ncbi:MAG: 50S ribosomal protein L18 [Candidatus Micrarchaeota archaeon]|nr:50S ribosomal protein L18 [Candidatus Micrarchaeota archaeon]
MPRRLRKVPHRRVREGKTNFRQRLELLKSEKPRFVVRRANRNMQCQVVYFDKKGDITKVSASSMELADYGWNANTGNIPAAYLTALLCAVRAKAAGIKTAVLDIGLFEGERGSRIFATLKGAIDGGLDIPHSEDAFPSEDRVNGKHIALYAEHLKKDDVKRYEVHFSAYLKSKIDPASLPDMFASAKNKIIAEDSKAKEGKGAKQNKAKKQ